VERVECSFCGSGPDEQPDGRRVIAGPQGVAICSDCVRLCVEVLEEEPPPRTPSGVWATTTYGARSD
jgi:ATP-dependent Clp protease ATP-binding subunit ClpX